jgi:hypothetical protein
VIDESLFLVKSKKNGTKKELKAVVKNESEAWKLINMMTFFVVHSF